MQVIITDYKHGCGIIHEQLDYGSFTDVEVVSPAFSTSCAPDHAVRRLAHPSTNRMHLCRTSMRPCLAIAIPSGWRGVWCRIWSRALADCRTLRARGRADFARATRAMVRSWDYGTRPIAGGNSAVCALAGSCHWLPFANIECASMERGVVAPDTPMPLGACVHLDLVGPGTARPRRFPHCLDPTRSAYCFRLMGCMVASTTLGAAVEMVALAQSLPRVWHMLDGFVSAAVLAHTSGQCWTRS